MKSIFAITALIAATGSAALVDHTQLEPAMGTAADSAALSAAETLGPIKGDSAAPMAACQDVDIRVDNQKSVKIKALKVDYKTIEDGHTRTEQFADTVVPANTNAEVAHSQNLQYIEGQTMQWMKLYYKAWCGGKWSVTKTFTDSTFDSAQCVYGKTYRIDLPSTNPC